MAGTITAKLVAVQEQLKAPKGQRNSFGNYNYRSAEDIIEAAKPVLAKNGLALIITDEIVLIGDRYYVKAKAKLHDKDSDASVWSTAYAREDQDKKGMDGAQITGAASSYARKYALNGLFAIDDTKDADTNEHRQQNTQQSAPVSKPAISGTAHAMPAATNAEVISEAQGKLLLAKARDASGLTEWPAIRQWFLARYGVQVNDVYKADHSEILRDLMAQNTEPTN